MDIHLHDFITLALPGVGDGDTGLNLTAMGQFVAAERQRAIREGGVGKTVAEGEYGTAVDVGVVGGVFAEPFVTDIIPLFILLSLVINC